MGDRLTTMAAAYRDVDAAAAKGLDPRSGAV
jgi:hypothetical protein